MMHQLKKIARSKPFIIVVAGLVSYTLAGFFLAPYLVRHYLPVIVQDQLKKQAVVGKVRVNPYLFTLEASDLRIQEADGRPMAGFKRLFIDFELKSLFNRAWTFRQVKLDGPAVNAVIRADGSLNLADLSPPAEGPVLPDKESQPPRLVFEDIQIDQGRVAMTDQRQRVPAIVTLEPLTLKVKNLTTLPGQVGEKSITATTSAGETLQWAGTISLNPVVIKGKVAIEKVKIATLWAFAKDALNLEKPSGALDLSADYSVDLGGKEPQVALTNLSVGLTGIVLKVQGARAPLLTLPNTRINGGRLDLTSRQLEIGSVVVKGGRADLGLDANGKFNWQQIATVSQPVTPSAPAPVVQRQSIKPWKIKLAAFTLGGVALDFQDLSWMPGIRVNVGELKVGLKAEAQVGGPLQVRVNDMAVTVSGFQAGHLDSAEPVLRLNTITLGGGAYDLAANRLTAALAAITGGAVDVRRQTDGRINLAGLLGPGEQGEMRRPKGEAVTGTAVQGSAFQFLIKSVSLSGLQAAFSDLAVEPDRPLLHLDDLRLAVSDLDGKSPMAYELAIDVRQGGRIKAVGTVDPSVPSVTSEVEVAELVLLPFQPYVDRVAAVVFTSGTFSTAGNLSYGVKTVGAQTVYQGGFKIESVGLIKTGGKDQLVGCKSVQSEQLKLTIEPNRIEIGEVRVVQPSGLVVIEQDRSFNLANVVKPGAPSKPQISPGVAEPAEGISYSVRRVMISDGRMDFADLSLPVRFKTKIYELKGNVAGIASTRGARAQVKLDGRVDDFGTAKIDGELNTSDPKAFTDINVVFRNVEMSRLSPYSGKFAGRKIDSGKLSVDLKYKIENSRLAGENQIVVERLSLGEKVKSPQAVDLPLDLAVALLEDAHGVIELGLPVKGNLDSPEFSYGAIIGKAIVNLLMKIVTSPFRILGALIPGGSEEALKKVDFEPGSTSVSPPQKEKLAKLAGAMQKRPQLKLLVQGRYNPATDGAELRATALSRALAARLGQDRLPSEDPGPVDFSSPDTTDAVEAMFSERFGADALKAVQDQLKAAADKAKTETAAKEQATAPEIAAEDPGRLAKLLFDRLVAVEPVDPAALAQLADARAQAVIAELNGPLAIPAERLGTKASSAALGKSDPVTAALSLEVMP